MADVLFVGNGEIALAEREIINRVEDIGFSCAVKAHETVYLLREKQVSGLAVFEVSQL